MSDTQTLTPVENALSLAAELAARRQARLERESNKASWKPRRIYASGLSPCDRQMVYAFTHWQEKAKFPLEGIAAIQDGIMEEQQILRELSEDGFQPIETQISMDDERLWLTGKIDGKLRWNDLKVPFEIKRLKPFAFERIDTIDDLKRDPFLTKYLRQLTAYLYLHNEEAGLFILSNGCGARKYLVVTLEMDFAEQEVLQRCERVKAALDRIGPFLQMNQMDEVDRLLPDRISYDSKICGYCAWKDTCLPQVNFGDGAHLAEPEVAEKLRRFQELKPMVSEMERLKKDLKPVFEGKDITLAGGYVVTGKWQTRNVAAQAAREETFWTWKVEALEPLKEKP